MAATSAAHSRHLIAPTSGHAWGPSGMDHAVRPSATTSLDRQTANMRVPYRVVAPAVDDLVGMRSDDDLVDQQFGERAPVLADRSSHASDGSGSSGMAASLASRLSTDRVPACGVVGYRGADRRQKLHPGLTAVDPMRSRDAP